MKTQGNCRSITLKPLDGIPSTTIGHFARLGLYFKSMGVVHLKRVVEAVLRLRRSQL